MIGLQVLDYIVKCCKLVLASPDKPQRELFTAFH